MTNGDLIRNMDNDSLAFGFLTFMRLGEKRLFTDIPSKELHKTMVEFLDSKEGQSPTGLSIEDLKGFF